MAKGTYVGIGGSPRKVKKVYVGAGGVKKVKAVYVGVAGVPRLAWTSEVEAGQAVFTSSQTWTVPEGITKIDIFCVGGGGSGFDGQVDPYYTNTWGGAGGGGGRTATLLNHVVTPGQQIAVVVGAGAGAGAPGGKGGASSFGSVISADGGTSATAQAYQWEEVQDWVVATYGGSGGSGGAHPTGYNDAYGAAAATAGTDGGNAQYTATTDVYGDPRQSGFGQGTTTRAFGEASNTLYSGGGGHGMAFVNVDDGSSYLYTKAGAGGAGGGGNGGTGPYDRWSLNATLVAGQPGTPNTGGGGGGNYIRNMFSGGSSGYYGAGYGAGGSGIVIVRWAKQ